MGLDFSGREDTTRFINSVRYTLKKVWIQKVRRMHIAPRFDLMIKPLSLLPIGASGIVAQIVPNRLATKLVEMGLNMGSRITVMNRAPFNGPMAIDLGLSVLSLRLDEAEIVLVEEMA